MQFSDPAFLPIHYNFTTVQCGGQQLATFTVPAEVPNGDADIIWCVHACLTFPCR